MGMLLTRHYADKNEQTNDKGVAEKVAPKVEVKEEKASDSNIVDEIKAMSGAKLRKFAKENGVVDPEELTIGELKAILIEKLG